MLGIEVLWLLLTGVALSFGLPLMSPLVAVFGAVLAFTISFGLSISLWQYNNISMPIANSLVMVTLLFVLNMSYGYFFVTRTKRQITDRFRNYVPFELVDEISKHPEQLLSMEGESREMTILFHAYESFSVSAA